MHETDLGRAYFAVHPVAVILELLYYVMLQHNNLCCNYLNLTNMEIGGVS